MIISGSVTKDMQEKGEKKQRQRERAKENDCSMQLHQRSGLAELDRGGRVEPDSAERAKEACRTEESKRQT